MKIAFIATQWQSPWGGAEELWSQAARLALRRGHQVAVVSYRWPEMPPRIRELQGHGALLLPMARPDERRRSAPLRWARKLEFERFRVWGRLASWGPDVACVSQGGTYDVFSNGVFINFVTTRGLPFIVICQWNSEDMHLPHEPIRRIADGFFSRARCIAFVSERNLRVAERQVAGDLPNACVVRNPVNLVDFARVPYPRSDVVKMANVARHDVQCKGQDLLLEAMGGGAWKRRQWRLRLYGAGKDRVYLERLADYYDVADKVDFCGHVSDIRSLWADNHLLVMPSRSEGTPLALVEAMICGRPSVVTDVGGNAEWVDEPATGFIAEAPSARSLGGALERAWEARGDWEAMGRRAHEVAVSRTDPHPEEAILSLLSKAESGTDPVRVREGMMAE